MGWTHHWSRPTELPADRFADAARDLKRVLRSPLVPLAGFDGTGDPRLDPEHVAFNGAAPQHCEPFEIARVEFDRRGRASVTSHCKTERLPYDVYVQAALIIVKHHVGADIRVTSDGDDADWERGRRIVQEALGYGAGFWLDA